MTLSYISGCTVGERFEVDSQDGFGLSVSEGIDIFRKLAEQEGTGEAIKRLLLAFGECEWSESCEQCGDSIITYKLEL